MISPIPGSLIVVVIRRKSDNDRIFKLRMSYPILQSEQCLILWAHPFVVALTHDLYAFLRA